MPRAYSSVICSAPGFANATFSYLEKASHRKIFIKKSKCCCRANLKGGIVLEYVGIGLVALLAVLTVVSTVRFNRKPPLTREEYEEHERKRKGDE